MLLRFAHIANTANSEFEATLVWALHKRWDRTTLEVLKSTIISGYAIAASCVAAGGVVSA